MIHFLKVGEWLITSSAQFEAEMTHKTSGTVNGAGYDCRNGQVRKFEETDEGIWNMVGFDSKLWKWRFFKLLKWRFFISVLPCAVASER